ncbi:MAG: hypothetical protein ACRYFV_17315 [Janthinobacterium lividum]
MAIMVRVFTVAAPAIMVARATHQRLAVGTTVVAIMATVVAMAVEAATVVAGAVKAPYKNCAFPTSF